jgi:hypothetical protein
MQVWGKSDMHMNPSNIAAVQHSTGSSTCGCAGFSTAKGMSRENYLLFPNGSLKIPMASVVCHLMHYNYKSPLQAVVSKDSG